jgi:hypothetical protein
MQGRTGHITRWEKGGGSLRQSGAPQHHFFRSAWFVDIFCVGGGNSPLDFLFNDLLFFFFRSAISCFCRNFFFWGRLKKNPTKIWGASPPLVVCICLKDYETVDQAPSNRCTHYNRCAARDFCSGFVCSKELAWSAVWISLEVLELEFDDLTVLFQG